MFFVGKDLRGVEKSGKEGIFKIGRSVGNPLQKNRLGQVAQAASVEGSAVTGSGASKYLSKVLVAAWRTR